MYTKGHFLVTTADERTWDPNRKIVFLGGWCQRYDKKHIWNQLDSEIAPPYGVDLSTKLRDQEFSQSLQNLLLPRIVNILNAQHKTNHSLNFWKILLGHWLKCYVDVLINRYNSLVQVNDLFKITGSTFIQLSASGFVPSNTLDMYNLLKSDSWNSNLDLLLVKNSDGLNFPIKVISDLASNSNRFLQARHKETNTRTSLRIKKLSNCLVRNSEPFIVSSYLPIWQEIKLQLSFLQVPKFWNTSEPHFIKTEPDILLRKKLNQQILLEENNVFAELIFELMPVCFLEGFVELSLRVKKINWPKSPKFVFTSNDFAYNETFKLYAALCQEKGINYFVGQHGNNYGTNRFSNGNIEVHTPNFFLTWGWHDQSKSKKTGYIFKVAGKKIKHDNKGELLLFEFPYYDRYETWDVDWEHQNYFSDLLLFIRLIDEKPLKHLKVRFRPESAIDSFNSKQRLIESVPSIMTEYWETPSLKKYKKTRLAIYSYDSTGILESLALNVPTIAFWQNGFDHLNETAKSYYQEMVNAGIFHLNPESIAKTINLIWEDVDSWWNQVSIQSARKAFCEQFARTSQKPIRDLRELLKESTCENN